MKYHPQLFRFLIISLGGHFKMPFPLDNLMLLKPLVAYFFTPLVAYKQQTFFTLIWSMSGSYGIYVLC